MAKNKMKMVENNKNCNSFFKIVLGAFVLIFLFLAFNFITQDKYVFVLNFKWFKNAADIKVNMDWLIDLYTAFFLALIGLYFTIIGIGFSLKQISILVFYEFTFLTPISLSTFIVFVLNAVSIYCVLPNLRLTNAVVVYVFCSIVFCVTVFCYFSSRIFYTDDEGWAKNLLDSVLDKGKREKINKFINKFLIKSFEKEFPFIFFNTNESKNTANETFFESISVDEIDDLKTVENFMIVVSSKITKSLAKLDTDEDFQFEICNRYINIFARFYNHYLFTLHGDTSFILYIRDAFLLTENSTKSEKFFELYAIACKKVKDIVLTSFYQKTDETIVAYLNDYRCLNQLPLFYNNKKFNVFFNRSLVEISTYMFDIVAVGRHSNKIIPYAEKLFLSLEKIDVNCVSPVMYDEGNFSDIRVHEVKYTQEFLVVLILFYLMATNPNFDMKGLLKNKIRFVNYSFKEDENPLNLLKMGYSRFISCIEKISLQDINNIKTISEDDFRNTREGFISLLKLEISQINEEYKTELKATISDDKLNEFVKSEKTGLLDDLKQCFSEVDDASSYRNKTIEIGYNFLFSQKAYKENNEVIHVESFSHFVLEWFVQIYISHCNLKYFKTFSELDFEKGSNLLLHIDYMEEVFDDKTIELGIGAFGVNGNEFKTTYFSNGKRGLIYESDFKKHFAVKEIMPLVDQKKEEESDDDILVTIPVKIVFCEMDENPDFWILSK